MKLDQWTKDKITEIIDSKEFKDNLYVDSTGKPLDTTKRDKLGQFYTGSKICIKMIEAFDCESFAGQNILDPTVGSGNLLIACLIAGADLDRLYGNEYDADIIPTCRKRILRAAEILGLDTSKFRDWQIHQGNALQRRCLIDFSEEYSISDSQGCHYNSKYIDDLEYAQSDYGWRWENEHAKKRLEDKQSAEENKAKVDSYKKTAANIDWLLNLNN